MNSLLQILLEARLPLKGQLLKVVTQSNIPISIKYGAKWIKNVTVTSTEKRGRDTYIKADVKNSMGAVEKKEFKLKDITDWGEKDFRKASIKAGRKPKKPTEPSEETPKLKDIRDAIRNNRVIRIYYQGKKEMRPYKGRGFKSSKKKERNPHYGAGWRTILPVAYGRGFISNIPGTESRSNMEYIRAFQWTSPKTVTGVPKWKLFRMDRIQNWEDTGENYTDIRTVPGIGNKWKQYNPKGDDTMKVVYINAIFNKKGGTNQKLKEHLESLVKDILKS